ncbi:disease resistance protein RGA2 isoform X1 [Oryza sativa Japonica Group]|nr:disease resistance protein RGA2 isoform X1 [Oryza sativa Japonica Group]XP_015622672.1 disease resistance protein RGA2 isoform X1 [Oryza sativa Japonica Group]XP_015622677.1 disease resistance protein RGA2 isoform X1 [Oryza sativa Japonica Group]XP_025879162.1 disease resistance protein RGA2 isoform X1 [Oryza sativa Japonica Group]XP_025879163.1 disease resistance protein RGA2 isoform X1 [Oryza sativa Japonica Group]XP_025879164.1 disease resistance protein RGA2 isoform X1 [Oryza sativa Jap
MSLSKTIGFISGVNECVNLFQWARSAISSLHTRWSGTQDQKLQDEVLQLQSGLQRLKDTLPAMYDLIDRAEWRSHEDCVAKLLPNLKDAVYNADDLLDEFRWYEQKVALEGNAASQSPFLEFFDCVIQGRFNKVTDIIERLNNVSSELEKLGLREIPQRFDKTLRPETSSFPSDREIYGRDNELEKVMELLSVPKNYTGVHSKRKRGSNDASTSTSTSNQVSVPILPIVGIGGVGKTTLAQHICNHLLVKSHFDPVIWIFVSDDFDVKRLTKEAIESASGKEAKTDHLDSIQHVLRENVKNKRILIILDDVWDDALKENGQCWKKFCSPLANVCQGSMMLITTRSSKVSNALGTLEPFTVNCLQNDIFWDFFKLCAFGSDSSNNDPELECIGRSILPKLKGSPLAAKTLGRLLRMDHHTTHWKNVQKSELWELKQEETDILPALQLSYMYLPLHLKRCFSFCAVYPKDYNFEKDSLCEIWVAEGFVEPEGDIPILDTSKKYFEDLVSRSFFQKVYGTYVIHDLMHDMAQLVSKHDCFIIKDTGDFQKVPHNVRHLMILDSEKFDCSNLLSLCKHTKLRTILCNKSLWHKTLASVMDHWCTELWQIRVFSCAFLKEIPKSIGNLKHLRYLQISGSCHLNSIPLQFCCLYNLQCFNALECVVESLPCDFDRLINLRRYKSQGFVYDRMGQLHLGTHWEHEVRLMKNFNQFYGDLRLSNLGALSKDLAAEIKLNRKRYIGSLTLQWCLWISQEHNEMEVFQVLHPPTSLRSLKLMYYLGESLPCWFQEQNGCNEIAGVIANNNNGCISVFSSLTYLDISDCEKLSNLNQFLQVAHVPSLERIRISNCGRVASTPRFGDFHCLEELILDHCKIFDHSESLSIPSLKKLVLHYSGNPISKIECRSLTSLSFVCPSVTSIPLQVWSSNLPALQNLDIKWCPSLTFIGESEPADFTNLSHQVSSSSSRIRTFSSLTVLTIHGCEKLLTLDDLLKQEYLPFIKSIKISYCQGLLSLPGEMFGSFPFLNDLGIWNCPSLTWQRGLVLPSSLLELNLIDCGYFSTWLPSCLENVTSLVILRIIKCRGITYITDQTLSSNLASLQELCIEDCPDLVSIGRGKLIAKLKKGGMAGKIG